MRRKLMITLLTMTMTASLFVGCGTSETVETPVEEETVVEETADVETEEPETTEVATVETEETAESETVAKPKASTHYKEWKEKQEEEVAEPEVAEKKEETTKKETEKKEDTSATTTTNTNTNNNTPAPTPEPTPATSTPSNNNTTTPVAETPAAPAAPAAPTGWNCSTQGHKMSSTLVDARGITIGVGNGQYEQVQVGAIPGDPIYDTNPDSPTYGTVIGNGPETPIYETREVLESVLVMRYTYQDTCSVCGYSTTRTEDVR